jgi:hypothetical protein
MTKSMTDICERANKLWRHCDWEHLYDVVKPSKELQHAIYGVDELPEWLAELGVTRCTWVASICKTCGRFNPRPSYVDNELSGDTK